MFAASELTPQRTYCQSLLKTAVVPKEQAVHFGQITLALSDLLERNPES
jgi:hypothetical protein